MENLFTTWLLTLTSPSPLQISNFLRAVAIAGVDINDILAYVTGNSRERTTPYKAPNSGKKGVSSRMSQPPASHVLNSYYLDALNIPVERKISRSDDRKDHWKRLVALPHGIRKQYIVDKYLKKVPGATIVIPRFPGGVRLKGPPPKETVPLSFKPTKNDIEDFTELTRLGYISNFDLVDMVPKERKYPTRENQPRTMAGVKSLNEVYMKILGEELIRRSKILNFLEKNRKAFMELRKIEKGKTRQVTPPRSSFMNSKGSMDEYFKKLSKKEKAEEKASGKTVLAEHLRGRYIEGSGEGSSKSHANQRKLSDDRKKIEKELMVLIDKDGDVHHSGYELIREKDDEPYYKFKYPDGYVVERPKRPQQEALLKKLGNSIPNVANGKNMNLAKKYKKYLKEGRYVDDRVKINLDLIDILDKDEKNIARSVEKIQQKKANMWVKNKNAEEMAEDMDAFVKKQKKYTDRVAAIKLAKEHTVDNLTRELFNLSLSKKRKRIMKDESPRSLKRIYEEDKKNRRGVKEIVLPKSKFNVVNKVATAIDSLVLDKRRGSAVSSKSSSSRRGSASGSAKSSRRSSVASGYSQVPSDDEES
jgi:hypothetical protein